MKLAHLDLEPLDARQLRALCVLGDTGSFTLTARRLHLTQSAVSHSMKALEGSLGIVLIERSGRKALLTQAGQALVIRADRLLREMAMARTEIEHLTKWGGSLLRLGASQSTCQYILPKVLAAFRTKFPRWQIEVSARDSSALPSAVLDGEIDLALCTETSGEMEALEFRPLYEEEISVIFPAKHRWVGQEEITLEEILTETVISYRMSSDLTRTVRAHFQKVGLRMSKPAMELGNLEAIKEMVKLGMGVALMPSWIASRDVEADILGMAKLAGGKLRREWGLAYRKGRRLSHGEEEFARLCGAVGRELPSS